MQCHRDRWRSRLVLLPDPVPWMPLLVRRPCLEAGDALHCNTQPSWLVAVLHGREAALCWLFPFGDDTSVRSLLIRALQRGSRKVWIK